MTNKATKPKGKILIGRSDRADFPRLKLFDIPVKIDTGAYTSSMHCHDIRVKDGVLKCRFLDPGHPQYHGKVFVFKKFTEKKVKSSNGFVEERYTVKTRIVLFERSMYITLTLTERGSMNFPVLLGRKFLSSKFLVDPSRENLSKQNIQIPCE